MSYDSKTNTINLGPDSDFLVDSGAHFINVLRSLAQEPNAATSLKNDWKTIEGWLGCADRALTSEDIEKIGKAWRAYCAIGVAPSHALQSSFDEFSSKYKSIGQPYTQDRPHEQIMDVFDRLLASDDEIKEKKAADLAADKPHLDRLAELLRNVPGKPKTSWWRRQSQTFRAWAFVSLTWAAASLFYILVFDPFELDDWSWADGQDYLKVLSVVIAPVILGLIKRAYDRIVK